MMKERNSTFEIMRILAMFMVILGHCTLATAQNVEPYLGILDCTGWGIKAFTVCAVNLFFLLTGYFVSSKNFRISRNLEIWFKTIFYSVTIYFVISFATSSFSIKESIGYFLPVLMKKYWFIQTYIVIALVAPFIAISLESLSDKKILFLVVILLCFFSFHQTFIKVSYTLDQTQGYGFVWGCVMLVLGYYLKRITSIVCKLPVWIYLLGYILVSGAIFLSNILIVKLGIAGGVTSRGNFYAYNSVTVLVQSICLFCFFVKLSQKNWTNKIVNSISKNVLAGYLISAHPLLLYPLWTDYLKMQNYTGKIEIYIGLAVIYTVIILLVCVGIDKIVDKFIEKSGIKKLICSVDKLYMRLVEDENII